MRNNTVKSSLREKAQIFLFITGFILLNVESPVFVIIGLSLWALMAISQ